MLRDYQQQVYDRVADSFRRGHKRPLVVLPCGAGKSYILSEMAAHTDGEVLILTHRRELLEQHRELLSGLGVQARIAMVMTEANRLGRYPRPRLILADEAHLSRSNSWVKVLNYYNTCTVGFTATPIRLDGKPLGDIYDDLITGVDAQWLIDHQCLAPYDYYAPTAVETDSLRVHGGDFLLQDLEELMHRRAVYSDVLESWRRLAEGRKTIAYCVSVHHARETAARFRDAGYPAAALDQGTSLRRRRELLEQFRAGALTVLCNVGIISEGISINDVSCCLLLRPTESHALYWQQAMRCMRYQPGKRAVILDCVGNYTRNPLPGTKVEWSLSRTASKRKAIDENGNFYLRTCPACFKVFHTADTCPYCGAPYPLHPRELEARREVELARITAEQARAAEQARKAARREQGMADSYEELVALAVRRGYKRPAYWAARVFRGRRKA